VCHQRSCQAYPASSPRDHPILVREIQGCQEPESRIPMATCRA
jgi:hypothetical protein